MRRFCTQSPSPVAFYLYDAVYLYMRALNETIADGDDFRNGSVLVKNSIGQNFVGKKSFPFHERKGFCVVISILVAIIISLLLIPSLSSVFLCKSSSLFTDDGK